VGVTASSSSLAAPPPLYGLGTVGYIESSGVNASDDTKLYFFSPTVRNRQQYR